MTDTVDVQAEEVKPPQDEYAGFVAQLTFNITDLRLIYQSLGKMPMELAEPVVNLLRAQVTPQLEQYKKDQDAKVEEKVGGDKSDKK